MKIHVLSDLHLDFANFEIPETDADVIVLAGDVAEGHYGIFWILKQLAVAGKPVIYVPGNHEFYKHDISLFDELDLQELAKDNIHVLNNKQLIIDGVRFLGSTLWTDFELLKGADSWLVKRNAKENMSDFHVISDGEERFTPMKSVELHHESREWLAIMLEDKFDGKTVVVTHHVPSEKSCHPRFKGSLLNPAFASNLEWMMGKDRVGLWIHGHTHDAYDYEINGTRVVCNPRGYPREKSEFEEDKVVEI